MTPLTFAGGDLHRRAPRRGPTRTLRTATVGSLRSGPQRLYPVGDRAWPQPIPPHSMRPLPQTDLINPHP